MPKRPQDIPIQRVVNALLDDSTPFPPGLLPRFSDLEGVDLDKMTEAWPRVNPNRRIALMDDLEEIAESDTLENFDNFARSVVERQRTGRALARHYPALGKRRSGPRPSLHRIDAAGSLARSPRCRGIRIG